MADINLLPTQLKASKEAVRTGKTLTKVTLFSGAVLLIISLLGGGLLYFTSQQLKKLELEQQALVSNVSNLESTEQSLVVIRDRITKINQVLGTREQYEVLGKYDSFISTLPQDSTVKTIELDSGITRLTLKSTTSTDLVNIIDNLKSTETFGLVHIVNLEFSPITGYELTLDLL